MAAVAGRGRAAGQGEPLGLFQSGLRLCPLTTPMAKVPSRAAWRLPATLTWICLLPIRSTGDLHPVVQFKALARDRCWCPAPLVLPLPAPSSCFGRYTQTQRLMWIIRHGRKDLISRCMADRRHSTCCSFLIKSSLLQFLREPLHCPGSAKARDELEHPTAEDTAVSTQWDPSPCPPHTHAANAIR